MLHAAAGECVTVQLTERPTARASFAVDKLAARSTRRASTPATTPRGLSPPAGADVPRLRRLGEIGSAVIADFGDFDSGAQGLYGA